MMIVLAMVAETGLSSISASVGIAVIICGDHSVYKNYMDTSSQL